MKMVFRHALRHAWASAPRSGTLHSGRAALPASSAPLRRPCAQTGTQSHFRRFASGQQDERTRPAEKERSDSQTSVQHGEGGKVAGETKSATPVSGPESERTKSMKEAKETKHNRPPMVIVSGIQPTGSPHIGNLLGALFNWVRLQKSAPPKAIIFLFIADLHALTAGPPSNAAELESQRLDMVAALLAVGIDPERCRIFMQSSNAHHSQMMWGLSCLTNVGRLARMTTWKSKTAALAAKGTSALDTNEDDADAVAKLDNAVRLDADVDAADDPLSSSDAESELHGQVPPALLMYPVLQAADILSYRATHVPVGEDQIQHLELTRSLARSANRLIARLFPTSEPYFPEPQAIVTSTPRVYSLRNPEVKMSKSDPNPDSCIFITDSREDIERKVKSAVSDTEKKLWYDPEQRKAIANLLSLCAALENYDKDPSGVLVTPQDVADRLNGASPDGKAGAGSLKKLLTQLLCEIVLPIGEKYKHIRSDRKRIYRVLNYGSYRAEKQAGKAWDTLSRSLGLCHTRYIEEAGNQ